MNIQKIVSSTLAIGGFALLAAGAQAQTFSYTTVFSPNPITSSPLGNFITITNGSNPLINGGGIGSAMNLSNFVETSNVAPPSAVTFSQPFTIALSITPTGSLTTETKNFTGTISGQYNTNQSLTATIFNAPLSQTFDFGSAGAYTVSQLAFQQPGPQGSSTVGSIGGLVTYTAAPTTVPEPATVVPFAIGGLALLGLMARKSRRSSNVSA